MLKRINCIEKLHRGKIIMLCIMIMYNQLWHNAKVRILSMRIGAVYADTYM